MKRPLLTSLLLICSYVMPSVAKEWCGIVPLHSTRADVERLLKVKPGRCRDNTCIYDLPDKTVLAFYAEEPTCRKDGPTTSWKVPADTVIEITVNFKTPQLFSALDIDVTKFDRVADKELKGLVYLSDYDQGVRMETSGDSVRAITYYAAAKDHHLHCSRLP